MYIRRRVFTYITYNKQLLVLDHVNQAELSMQIPGGTIEAGETPEVAAMRESEEETGLQNIMVKTFLGDFEKDLSSIGRAETIHAYFYHLEVMEQPPSRWRHTEMDPHNRVKPILFELYWVPVDPRPTLGGIDGAKYDELLESIRRNASVV